MVDSPSDTVTPDEEIKAWRVEVGRRVKEYRRKRGLSQQALADMTSTLRPIISKIELGNTEIRARHLLEIAAALVVRPSELVPEISVVRVADVKGGTLSELLRQAERLQAESSELVRLLRRIVS